MAEVASMDNQLQNLSVDPTFRPLKRRRNYRRHSDEAGAPSAILAAAHDNAAELHPSEPVADAPPVSAKGDDDEKEEGETQLPVSEILRLRKQVRHRRGGIEFAATHAPDTAAAGRPGVAATADGTEEGHGERDGTTTEAARIGNRFAPQTGQVADVNKHMTAYIASELAKRRQGEPGHNAAGQEATSTGDSTGPIRPAFMPKQPATLGKLHEIDLGLDNRIRNIQRTEAAKRRAANGGDDDDDDGGDGRRKLGKDGKPWKGRKRRTSEDIRRDKLVEEVLREARIELYDEPEAPTKQDDTQAADDRIAEQFRRDFLDAISNRHRRRFGGNRSAHKKRDDRPRGPKLGGSRSARAAMREQQNKTKQNK